MEGHKSIDLDFDLSFNSQAFWVYFFQGFKVSITCKGWQPLMGLLRAESRSCKVLFIFLVLSMPYRQREVLAYIMNPQYDKHHLPLWQHNT